MITFIAVDFFELVDLEQYDLPLDILSLHPDKVYYSVHKRVRRFRKEQIYPQLDFWGLAEPYLDKWLSDQFSPLKIKDFILENKEYVA